MKATSKQGVVTLAEAKALLDDSQREELRDHAFGDTEYFWKKNGIIVADGYSSYEVTDVTVWIEGEPTTKGDFDGDEAKSLLNCGTLTQTWQNDTGPQE